MLLFVFDESFSDEEAPAGVPGGRDSISLFDLAGNWGLARRLDQALLKRGLKQVVALNSARLVEREIEAICRELPKWSAERGDSRIRDASVRRFFMTGEDGMSGFWLGPISEKNPLKTDTFLRLAQALAVHGELRTGKYEGVAAAVKDRNLRKSIKRMADAFGVPFHLAEKTGTLDVQNMRSLLPDMLSLALAGWLQACWKAVLAKAVMGFSRREEISTAPRVFVSYFPYLNEDAGGAFRNKYFEPVQNICPKRKERIFWLLMFTRLQGVAFLKSLKMAKKFGKNGERLAFFDEFFGFREAVGSFYLWLRQLGRYFFLERNFSEEQMCGDFFPVECYPLVRDLWRRSFCGVEAVRGLIQYKAFRRFFRDLGDASQCVYPCEMQAWEKALNKAIERERPELESVGYIHTTISRDYVFFAHHESEIESPRLPDGLPLPGKIAANGAAARARLSEWGYPGLCEVEAIRQLPLAARMNDPRPLEKGSKPTLLVVGTVVREETKALLLLLSGACPLAAEWAVWLKGHPAMPMGLLLRDLGIHPAERHWEIKEGDIDEYLQKADVVLVATSSTSIDALAFGCEVFTPVFSSGFTMNVLSGFEDYYHSVSTPEELREKLENYLKNGPRKGLDEKRDFVRSYWNLDAQLPGWRTLLNMEASAGRCSIDSDK